MVKVKMSCEDCDKAKFDGVAYYRWGVADIGIMGCNKHLREVMDALTKIQSALK